MIFYGRRNSSNPFLARGGPGRPHCDPVHTASPSTPQRNCAVRPATQRDSSPRVTVSMPTFAMGRRALLAAAVVVALSASSAAAVKDGAAVVNHDCQCECCKEVRDPALIFTPLTLSATPRAPSQATPCGPLSFLFPLVRMHFFPSNICVCCLRHVTPSPSPSCFPLSCSWFGGGVLPPSAWHLTRVCGSNSHSTFLREMRCWRNRCPLPVDATHLQSFPTKSSQSGPAR